MEGRGVDTPGGDKGMHTGRSRSAQADHRNHMSRQNEARRTLHKCICYVTSYVLILATGSGSVGHICMCVSVCVGLFLVK